MNRARRKPLPPPRKTPTPYVSFVVWSPEKMAGVREALRNNTKPKKG